MNNNLLVVPSYNTSKLLIYEKCDVRFSYRSKKYNPITKKFIPCWNTDGLHTISTFHVWSRYSPLNHNVVRSINNYISQLYNNEYNIKLHFLVNGRLQDKIRKQISEEKQHLFIKEDTIVRKFIGNDNTFKDVEATIYVTEVREEVIAFLKHIGCKDIKLLEELKILFDKSNCSTLKEYIVKKSKFLVDLDLDNYVKELNSHMI
jgi:hypothetical protein